MRRSIAVCCLVAAFLFLQLVSDVFAQPPELLRNYRFLPRRSTLNVSGGFAGLQFQGDIFGRYGLTTGFRPDDRVLAPIAPLVPFAEFVDVHAEAINPTDFGPYSFDLDQSLNLSGLKGRPVPTPFASIVPPFEVFEFTGEDGQGAPMTVHALTVGRWMFMRGANDPSCCDFFEYRLRSLARQRAFADTNDDDTVDGNDLASVLNAFGSTGLNITDANAEGDLDGDGDIDGNDFLSWQRQYQQQTPSLDELEAMLDNALTNILSGATGVPEPGTFVLIGLALSTGLARRWRVLC